MNKEFFAYCAGFIDGEGCFDISILRPTPNNRRKYTFYVYRLTVSNTYKEVLEEMQQFFHGKIFATKLLPNRRQCYVLTIHGDNLVYLCENLLPYFRVKKRQAETILEYSKTIDGRRHTITDSVRILRESLHKRMRDLNHGIKE